MEAETTRGSPGDRVCHIWEGSLEVKQDSQISHSTFSHTHGTAWVLSFSLLENWPEDSEIHQKQRRALFHFSDTETETQKGNMTLPFPAALAKAPQFHVDITQQVTGCQFQEDLGGSCSIAERFTWKAPVHPWVCLLSFRCWRCQELRPGPAQPQLQKSLFKKPKRKHDCIHILGL